MHTFFKTAFQKLHEENPLIHHITNYVTVNDCANITLAIGASPIMADDCNEVAEIIELASALVINIGTLNERTIPAMLLAGKKANQRKIPVILDPVGAGVSSLRNETTRQLLNEVDFAVIRGNSAEIQFLAGLSGKQKGVDAGELAENEVKHLIHTARLLATAKQTTIVVSGKTDIISDGAKTLLVHNGCQRMSQITGTGCMLTSLVASFCASNHKNLCSAAATAVATMGVAGELADRQMSQFGTASFRTALIDQVSQMGPEILAQRSDIYEV